MATPEPDPTVPKTFISYSWDDDAHKEWVKQLASRLRADGVDVTLDRWHSAPGDQIPAFMERAVRENDFVIAICTTRFKERSDRRGGGVGYEGDIMTAYAFTGGAKKKFIPVLRRGSWGEAAPTWLFGRAKIDLSGDPYSESEYEELLRTLHGAREEAPPIGSRPSYGDKKGSQASPAPAPITPRAGIVHASTSIGGAAAMTRALCWLHVSDRHIGDPSGRRDDAEVTQALRDRLRQDFEVEGLKPDFLFFTGDLAFGETRDPKRDNLAAQFDQGHEFLAELGHCFDPAIPIERIFLVPGNHDVNRTLVTPGETMYADQIGHDVLETHLRACDGQCRTFMTRLRDYREFLSRHRYDHLLQDEERLWYAHTIPLPELDLNVSITGFNSAWSSCRDKERGSLRLMGEVQRNSVQRHVNSASDVRIALIHHPPSWFDEREEPSFTQDVLEPNYHFCLHGHEHNQFTSPNTVTHLRVSAGACYEREPQAMGFNFVRIDVDTGETEIWQREFTRKGGALWRPAQYAHTDHRGVLRLFPGTKWGQALVGRFSRPGPSLFDRPGSQDPSRPGHEPTRTTPEPSQPSDAASELAVLLDRQMEQMAAEDELRRGIVSRMVTLLQDDLPVMDLVSAFLWEHVPVSKLRAFQRNLGGALIRTIEALPAEEIASIAKAEGGPDGQQILRNCLKRALENWQEGAP